MMTTATVVMMKCIQVLARSIKRGECSNVPIDVILINLYFLAESEMEYVIVAMEATRSIQRSQLIALIRAVKWEQSTNWN